jgi:hypothetical protein
MENDDEDVCSYWMILRKGYWKLKEEELACSLWTNRFGAGYGPVVRQVTE